MLDELREDRDCERARADRAEQRAERANWPIRPRRARIGDYRGLHKLKGDLRAFWSIDLNGRWRLLFRFKDGDAFDVHIFDPD